MKRRFAGTTTRNVLAAVLLAVVSGLLSIPRTSVTSAAPLFPTFSYPSNASYIGNFTSYAQAGNTITLSAGSDRVKVIVNEHDLVRIAYGPGGVFADENTSYAVVKYAWSNPTPLVEDRPTDLVITTDQLYVRIIKTPLRIEFYDKTPTLLGRDKHGVGRPTAGHIGLSQSLAAGEHIYGFGERCATSLDCRGMQIENWTRDAYNAKDGMKYKAFTLYHSTKGYGVFVDNHAHAVIDIGQSVSDELEYDFDGGKLDYYFFKGTSRQVLERYTDLTGRPALFPKWALGYQQAKWAYETRAELLATADNFRSKNIPADVLWLDGPQRGWWPSGRNVDPSFDGRYPDPTGMIAELASKGFKLGLLINQTMDTVAPKYTEGVTNNYYVKNQDGSVFISSQWNGSAATVDFTKAGAGAWYGGLLAPLVTMGARAWWIDMDDGGYPENLDGYYNRVFAGGPGWKVHNVNGGLLDANALRSSLTQQTPNARQFVMTRGGASGMQRSAWTWSADLQFNSWEDLKRQLRMEQNMSMVGVVYSSDIAGADCPLGNNGEAYLRWMQVEMFNFFTRSHFNGANCVDKHPWTYGATIESAWKNWIGWKYRMLPYIYTEHYTYTQTGTPLHRPLVFEYPNDSNVYNKPDEFMFGDSLLVAPVVDGNGSGGSNVSRSVYLPAGTWIDYRDGRTSYTGPTTLSNYAADLNTVPLFVKAGAILPMQPLMQYVGQLSLNLLTLDMYPSGNTSYTLYEDDGTSFGYQNGAWVKTKFDSSTSGNSATVVINARQSGGGAFAPAARDYMLKLHNRADGVNTVKRDGVDLPSKTLAELNAGQTGWNHDLANDLVWIRFGDTGNTLTIDVTDGGPPPDPPVLTTVSVTPSGATVTVNGAQQFSAVGLDQYGSPVSPQPSFAWSVSGGGAINSAGVFTAGSTSGGPFTVTAVGNGMMGTASVTVTAVPAFAPVRINAGGPSFVDSLGQTWAADKNFSGGSTYSTGASTPIAGTTDDTLYRSERWGPFSYNVPVPNGTYTVTLKFAEIYWTSTGSRVFSVTIEGQPVLSSFDIFAAAGANTTADRSFQATVADGTLTIAFSASVDDGKLSALEVVAAGPPAPDTTPPVRSGGAPSGTLAAGTTQATLSLVTNESATCRYGTTAGTAYGSLPSAFTNTGGAAHSTVVTGLTNGSSYSYVVRCQDTAPSPNANANDYVIAFSVATPNTAPTISDVANQSIATNSTTGALAFTVGDGQTAPGSLTVTRASSNVTLIPLANVVLGGSGAARTVTVTPAPNQAGSATITLTVSDGALTANDTFVVTVTAPPGANTTLLPSAATIVTGTLNGGTATSLATDDNAYFAVNSTTSGTRTTAWYGAFTGVSSSLTNLRVNYKGNSNNSPGCTQTIAIWRWTDSTWVQLNSTSNVSTTEIAITNLLPSAPLANYVSASGELRVRVQCTRNSNFIARGDAMSIVYDVLGPPPPDTTAPVLSNGAPSGVLAAGTTQTTLNVTTNENATCKYGTTAGVAYGSIANTFTTTGGTAHSALVTGLTNGSSYSYFVRCQDPVPNANSNDYTISFSVATPTPAITQVAPTSGVQGASNLVVTVTGQFTNWANGSTTAAFGAGITGTTTVTDATHLSVTLSIAAGAAVGTRTVTVTTGAQVLTLNNGFAVTAAAPAFTPIRINSGGATFVDGAGQTWAADKNFSGGSPDTTTVAVAGTTDDTLYHTERYGNFSYNIPVPAGTYTVTLRFAELYWTTVGKRVFSVAIEGQSVLSNFDIVAAGGANTAVDRTFQVSVADGTLNLVFTTVVDNAEVTAVQVVAGN